MARNSDIRIEEMVIVGKNISQRELVFHNLENFFFAVTRPRDETGTAYALPVTEEMYLRCSVGDTIDVPQYSANGKQWYFSREEAAKFTAYSKDENIRDEGGEG